MRGKTTKKAIPKPGRAGGKSHVQMALSFSSGGGLQIGGPVTVRGKGVKGSGGSGGGLKT
eukprot:CAMPEP_0174901342 /NCGR_PEP_ID=MMETSP0167-20121228/34271_1 /TAXON_ID=38298 /ORGANISM="Rhodella maculata, Strain CCMP736" /LENGTH=59 /DNA_ID=CAMNT_0016142997 /DNA_START=427 /DNA_END=603 /DNA_ORIENTATION=-